MAGNKPNKIVLITDSSPVRIYTAEFIQVEARQQTYGYQVTGEIKGTRFRLHVHRDDHNEQSRVKAEMYSTTDMRWNEACTFDGHSAIVLAMPSGYSPDTMAKQKACELVASALIQNLLFLLGVNHA